MTASQPSKDPFEQAREYERIIAEAMWSVRPADTAWDSLVYVHNQIGSRGSSITKIFHRGDLIDRKSIIKEIAFTVDDLRELMYKPGKGTWFSMTIKITREGDGWEADYNYTEKPVWELGEPVNDTYAQELYLFPRDEEHIPDWFKEEIRGSTWTPETD
ncbi:hypothetical protein [Arthrobacter sp. StoSoilB22]|uniref:hypothetical protein n=1 Tax=Arthrobacter sp. StoSoilB22 TaxID=2830996 RepID=UPI001CC371A1|nr:hypothetical protein [Arthrobacter sp. StoSoilB22]BCW64139.1 hypothetical protein StoSoilB22_31120 [Arthrobacter sp. StoSoilB22]